MLVDERIEKFAELKEAGCSLESESWNETDTRSKLIDSLLLGCLGWQESDIRRELSNDRSRLDYRLSIATPMVVIEAKKFKTDFALLPSGKPRTNKIQSLLRTTPSLKEHVEQVASYCHRFSIPFAALTNGRSYIVFAGSRTDSTPWLEGDAIVFADIFSAEFDFAPLHSLLSRESVAASSLHRELLGGRNAAVPATVLSTYADPDAVIEKNPLGSALEPVIQNIFSDVIDEVTDEFLKHCYVLPAETSLRSSELEYPLLDVPGTDDRRVINVDSRRAFEEFERTIADRLVESRAGSTLLLIGNLGVGKTIFLQRFFSKECNTNFLPSNIISFVVDFREGDIDSEKVHASVYERLRDYLHAMDAGAVSGPVWPSVTMPSVDLSSLPVLENVFPEDMARFRRLTARLEQENKGRFEERRVEELERLRHDDKRFVRGAIRYLRKNKHLAPCIILDNADHHTQDFQRAVYLTAKALEQELSCLVLLSVQEGSYWHFKRDDGPLASYQDTVFHIPAPRVKDVLAKRLDYAIGQSERFLPRNTEITIGRNVTLEPTHISEYLSKCKNAFFADDEIAVCYECLSNGNIRRGLALFATFLRSGHTDAQTYLAALSQPEACAISLDEVVNSIARGSHRYYSGGRSDIPNLFTLFQTTSDANYSRFGACYLLQFLSTHVQRQSSVGRGFVERAAVLRTLTDLGIASVDHESFLSRMYDQHLIRSSGVSSLKRTT
ncbi:MAG: hypothetical protein IIB77_12640 [Proteobacteria bacterium]|nr:hypothetical protein [Pseudomonadota bacterium]